MAAPLRLPAFRVAVPSMPRSAVMAILALSVAATVMPLAARADSHLTGDAEAGAEAFSRQCTTCHMVVSDTGERLAGLRGRTGPNLYGIDAQPLASVQDFKYGASMQAAGSAGLAWSEENFIGYVMDPTNWLRTALDDPGARAKMTFKVRKEDDARNIYAYLATLSSAGSEPADAQPDEAEADAGRAAPDPDAEMIPVTFSSEQSEAGEKRYKKDCQECHGDNLKGGLNGGAPLRGLAFEEKYFDALPASVMFGYMSSAMPPNSPGRYSANTYAELMAYILDRNGFRAGAPLPSDLDALDLMLIEK